VRPSYYVPKVVTLKPHLRNAGGTMSAPRNFHEAAVQDFRRYAFDEVRREANGFWHTGPIGRWYEPPNKRLQRPGAITEEVNAMTDEFIRRGYRYPHYNLPEDVRYFNIYHRQEKEYDEYPAKRRAYDY